MIKPLAQHLVIHQKWADDQLWAAIAAHAPARTDAALRQRLHHIHQVQRFFMWAIGDPAPMPSITRPDDFPTFDALRAYARGSHDVVRAATASLTTAASLERAVSIPWFADPPLSISVEEALAQMAMHSHYHRGQNATRLREIGGEPPPTDFIVWLWKDRPDTIA